MKAKKVLTHIVCSLLLVLLHVATPLQAQVTDVDQLTDEQLIQYMNNAGLSGLSEAELEMRARQKGIPVIQITKLKARLPRLQAKAASNTATAKPMAVAERTAVSVVKPEGDGIKADGLPVYGSELFSNSNISFEPNLRIPTPRNYVLGVDDELLIDIFGFSENSYKLKVQPEGHIRIPNYGPVRISGLTIEDAQKKIKQALTKIYPGIKAGNTSVQVSLGQIRSIRVTLIGDVARPGTFSLSSLSTIANALYNSGGINATGSYRSIQLIRNGKTIVTFDLYDFLNKGDLSKNYRLEDDDIIKVNPYKIRISLSGSVKKSAIYEVKENENLSDILGFAGGFTDDAYTEIIRVSRFDVKEKIVLSLSAKDFSTFRLKSGDVYVVDKLTNRYKNRVTIDGAVFHPGDYSTDDMKDLQRLLDKAGLREDAYTRRGLIRRLKDDFTPQYIDFNILDIINGKAKITLQREDVITIFSLLNLKEQYTVSINGEVNKPGTYEFSDSLKLNDLLLIAGGFTEAASGKKIEISRRLRGTTEADTATYALVKTIELKDITDSNTIVSEILQPFDIITVRKNPSYKEQIIVTLEGEVMYPGQYTLISKTEKLSDLIARAGGLKSSAYAKGAVLLRNTFETVTDASLLENKLNMLGVKSKDSSATETLQNSLTQGQKLVGIRLDEVIQTPGSVFDLQLQQGDIIKVPRQLQTVQAFGGIFISKKVVYREGLTFRQVINESGGFSGNALKRRSYVVYPNGEVRSTKKFLLFNNFPEIKPGSEVYVPLKDQGRRVNSQEIISYTTALVSVAAMVFGIINITK